MKATELRIGNYHLYHIVDELDERGEYDEVCQIDADDFRILENFDCPEYKPIPLNEEWLLKFGCIKYDYYYAINWGTNGVLIMKYMISYNQWAMELGTGFIKPLQYVHQLQNLYFALTGEELTTK